jgi:hypothetical protein
MEGSTQPSPEGNPMNSHIEEMQAEIDVMQAMIAGQAVIISSLIRTHSSYEALQMDLAGQLEVFLNGKGARSLNDSQKTVVQMYVEALQKHHSFPTPIAADLIAKIQRG